MSAVVRKIKVKEQPRHTLNKAYFRRRGPRKGTFHLGYRRKTFLQRKKNKNFRAYRRLSYIPQRKYKKKLLILKQYLFRALKFSAERLRLIFKGWPETGHQSQIKKFYFLVKYRLFLYLLFQGVVKVKWKYFHGFHKHRIEMALYYIKIGQIFLNSWVTFNHNYLLKRFDLLELAYALIVESYGIITTTFRLYKYGRRYKILDSRRITKLQKSTEILFNRNIHGTILINLLLQSSSRLRVKGRKYGKRYAELRIMTKILQRMRRRKPRAVLKLRKGRKGKNQFLGKARGRKRLRLFKKIPKIWRKIWRKPRWDWYTPLIFNLSFKVMQTANMRQRRRALRKLQRTHPLRRLTTIGLTIQTYNDRAYKKSRKFLRVLDQQYPNPLKWKNRGLGRTIMWPLRFFMREYKNRLANNFFYSMRRLDNGSALSNLLEKWRASRYSKQLMKNDNPIRYYYPKRFSFFKKKRINFSWVPYRRRKRAKTVALSKKRRPVGKLYIKAISPKKIRKKKIQTHAKIFKLAYKSFGILHKINDTNIFSSKNFQDNQSPVAKGKFLANYESDRKLNIRNETKELLTYINQQNRQALDYKTIFLSPQRNMTRLRGRELDMWFIWLKNLNKKRFMLEAKSASTVVRTFRPREKKRKPRKFFMRYFGKRKLRRQNRAKSLRYLEMSLTVRNISQQTYSTLKKQIQFFAFEDIFYRTRKFTKMAELDSLRSNYFESKAALIGNHGDAAREIKKQSDTILARRSYRINRNYTRIRETLTFYQNYCFDHALTENTLALFFSFCLPADEK